MRINLLSHDNGVGLTQDVKIVKAILDTRYKCKFIDLRFSHPEPADVNIFFEILDQRFYKSAKYNLLFPNPEWFMWPTLLKGVDLVLCKTKDAVRIFDILGSKTIFTSFTSEDRAKTYSPINERVYLHTAGQSSTKGTDTVFRSWKREYPEMIFTSLKESKQYENHLPNILTAFSKLSLTVLIELQNKAVFHLCPSEYEGFGHYIWEAKSARGIVITTAAPPMSEMVTEGIDGFLVKANRSKRMNYGRLQMVEIEDLRRVIEMTMQLSNQQIKEMRKASRESWEVNDMFFKEQLLKVIGSLK
jgi:glycosyltransferase involved in cell wall biosynthesis